MEAREELDIIFAKLCHDLNDGFQLIKRRDVAQRKMMRIYTDVVKARRSKGKEIYSKTMI